MRSWFPCLVCFVLSVAIASEKDPRHPRHPRHPPLHRQEKLKYWRHVKKFVEYDPPPVGNRLYHRQELENDGGKAYLKKSEDGEEDECLLGDDMTGKRGSGLSRAHEPVQAAVQTSEFNQQKWVMTVSSVTKFPITCFLFGQQMINYMETAWLAGRVLDRGLIEPSFIHQARGTVPVAGGRLFDLNDWTTKGESAGTQFTTQFTCFTSTKVQALDVALCMNARR